MFLFDELNDEIDITQIKQETAQIAFDIDNSEIAKSWNKIFEKYQILDYLKDKEYFEITANQIKEFKEPRLMAKFDTKDSLPNIFKKNGLGILPITRGTYVIGRFDLFMKFPEDKSVIHRLPFPKYETLDVNNITSEANALNAISISNMIDDFFGEEEFEQTFSGRMKSGDFSFEIGNNKDKVFVTHSQMEIDAGFENNNSIVICEAKAVLNDDFLVRQLYYPYRSYKQTTKKPIHNLFITYSNGIFRLMEYSFAELEKYNSIEFIKQKKYVLNTDVITKKEVAEFAYHPKRLVKEKGTFFPQADSIERLLSLMDYTKNRALSFVEIFKLFHFTARQAQYYFKAGEYLELLEKISVDEVIDGKVCKRSKIQWSAYARDLFPENKIDLRKVIEVVLSHEVFCEVVKLTIKASDYPDLVKIVQIMKQTDLRLNETTMLRRAQTVLAWVSWIFSFFEN